MVGIPKKALRESQLEKQTEGSAVNDGSHKIYRVKFIENGVSKQAFYKKLDPENFYPELLAKISVAASSFKRMSQGKRSAEERLVFDEHDNLVGTLSINIDNFKPFNFINEPVPNETNAKELVIPSLKTLIEKNIIELLLSRWFFDDDDVHPHNMGLEGDIDFDMLFYWFTIHIKKPREVIGVPKTRVDLSVRDYESFPNVLDSMPYHWPTYQSPGEVTLPRLVPAQGQILSRVLPKAYADPLQFAKLAESPKAQEQKLAAALKMLLTFQPEVQRKRLTDLFGDLPLNYTSLDEVSVELRTTYETQYSRFCNENTNKLSFVDFMMNLYQEHYDNLYRVVVFYMGCENNGYGISLPATFSALHQKPSFYKNIVAWVKQENETTYANTLAEVKYNLPELQNRYHQVWRDAFAPTLKELLHSSYALANKLLVEATSNAKVAQVASKQANDNSLTSSWELFGTVPELSIETIKSMITVDKDSPLHNALLHLVDFTNKFHALTKAYYTKERQNLNEQDNLDFCDSLTALINHRDFNVTIRQQLMNTTTSAKEFGAIASKLKLVAEQVNFGVHLTTDDEQMQETRVMVRKELLPLTHEEVLAQFNASLFLWAKGLKPEQLAEYINTIIDKKYSSSYLLYTTRTRGEPVKEYLRASMQESGDDRLAYILASGSTDDGALNTALIQGLTPYMLQRFPLQSITTAYKDGTFAKEISVVTKSSVTFAREDKNFTHFYSSAITAPIYQAIYDWVDTLSRRSFEGIINSTLAQYKAASWNVSRLPEVEGYMKNPDYWHAKIVALIFSQGVSTSSLNEFLFTKLVDLMKKDIGKNPSMEKEKGYQLIKRFNLEQHKPFYLAHIKDNPITTGLTHQRQKSQMEALAI